MATLTKEQGADPSRWRYGPLHVRDFPHPFVKEFDLPTVERNGGTGAVMADGASYREIWDVADWDRSVVTNVPGQSGQPESPFYGNLLPLWDRGEYFPMAYTRARVDQRGRAQIDAEAWWTDIDNQLGPALAKVCRQGMAAEIGYSVGTGGSGFGE